MGNTNEALKFARMEGELIQQLRKNEEATLIDLFEKKQDAKFYTISDSLMESKRKLQTKFNAAQTENALSYSSKDDGYYRCSYYWSNSIGYCCNHIILPLSCNAHHQKSIRGH